MRKKVLSAVMIGAAAMLFVGCASTAENMQAQGYGPDYSQGYGDGCESGKKAAGDAFSQFKKRVDRFDRDYKYREGWNDGFRTCKSEFDQVERDVREASREQAIEHSSDNRYRY